uniref:Rho guanine nucleotide exchange factor (GEF) 1 n=1 Tax=Scleropages formosus TaxID=113540 RepID=A0A8C9SJL1_SCLFO
MSIIGAEDEDFENDLEPTVDDQCSHFNSIELVKTRPTHLLVFLQHVMLQFDCAPLLCYLHADLFKNYSAKETKKQFLDFYNTFLDKGAILRVPVPSHVSYELDRTRPDLISEEVQKRYVQDIQVMVIPEVIMQLEDFRTKRMMGMTRHESELLEVESHHATERIPTEMKEKAVAETLLDRMPLISPFCVSFSSAIFGAVASYMKHLGVKTKTTDNKKSKGFFRKVGILRYNSDGGASASNSSLTGSVVGPPPPQEEVDPRLLELEQDPPNWREQVPSADFQSLSKKEIKRQEVINELFITEHAHVRMLSVLQMVFFRPMEHTEIASQPELATIFLSLDDIFEMHCVFQTLLVKLRQDDYIVKTIGKTLLNRFSGSEGDWFQKLTARFCSHQSYVLDEIKTRQKRDPRFGAFIQEAEGKPQCRRLQLKDIIPTEMQRLTKYPLLLENIAKSTEDPEEREMVQQAADSCRKILNHVNEEVKEKENLRKCFFVIILLLSNVLFQNIDLTLRKMIFEGPVTWKVTKEKSIEVQCLLLSDLLVLLQRQDDKMLLKCQSKNHSGVPEGKQMLSPIIKLSSAFLREVATDPKAFYVIFTWDSGAQIYELVANSAADRKKYVGPAQEGVEGCPWGRGGLRSLQPPLSLAENGSGARNANTGGLCSCR